MKMANETEPGQTERTSAEGTAVQDPESDTEDPESLSGVTRGNMIVLLAVGLLLLLGAFAALIAL